MNKPVQNKTDSLAYNHCSLALLEGFFSFIRTVEIKVSI